MDTKIKGFIQVTSANDVPVLINVSQITRVSPKDKYEASTTIYYVGGYVDVLETNKDVLRLIRDALY